jgi:hypothetical protein
MNNPVWSPAVRIMLHPASTYRELIALPARPWTWLGLRRLLLFAFVLACTVSFAASGRLTLRLVIPATTYAVLGTLVEVLALAVVRPRSGPSETPAVSFSRSLDLFFSGFGVWLLWLLAFGAIWAFASPVHAFRWTGPRWNLYILSALVLWSGYIDFCFFRHVFQRTRGRAARDLLVQRVISWTLAVIIFGGGPLWPEFIRSSGL